MIRGLRYLFIYLFIFRISYLFPWSVSLQIGGYSWKLSEFCQTFFFLFSIASGSGGEIVEIWHSWVLPFLFMATVINLLPEDAFPCLIAVHILKIILSIFLMKVKNWWEEIINIHLTVVLWSSLWGKSELIFKRWWQI